MPADQAIAPGPEAAARFIERVCDGQSVDPKAVVCQGPLYIALRAGLHIVRDGWVEGRYLGELLSQVLDEVRRIDADGRGNCLEIVVSHGYQEVAPRDFAQVFDADQRGRLGLAIQYGARHHRLSPTTAIAKNIGFQRFLQASLEREGFDDESLPSSGVRIWRFQSSQFLVHLGPPAKAYCLHRGNRVVRPEDIGLETIDDMIESMGDWMVRNVDADGRMMYKYWPSLAEESESNNTIRQYMATVCLNRLANATGDPKARAAADRNLAYNLDQFYRPYEDYGVIEFDGTAKLGAAALAALAILESPERARYSDQLQQLKRGILALWEDNGAFRTFHFPADRNDNQNFYPGEALLLWAHLHSETEDPVLLDRAKKSFAYYSDWHIANRNPAFVPWHSQAYAMFYQACGDSRLRDFVFEMNDWLLPFQQWESAPAPDLMGRFFDPDRRHFGPPHASATGVYLEGLADAYRLAEDQGDAGRAKAYATAIWRGLRSLRQLQFLDDVDMFYVDGRDKVHGGLRTETYNNEVRVDNVQHGLMALLKLRTMKAFRDPAIVANWF